MAGMRRRAGTQASTRRLEPSVTSYRDIVWQNNPYRLLKYRPSELHYYGWAPFLILRNVKATVFSDIYLYVQASVLLVYMGLLHTTGLGISTKDLEGFVRMVGTSYVGALFNAAMVITFILGLFTTLVINRWSGVRAAYGKTLSATMDLCMSLAHVVHNEQDWEDVRAARARTELTRLLNLGHVLVITSADAQNTSFKRSAGVKVYYRWLSRKVARQKRMQSQPSFLEGRRARDVNFTSLVQEGLVSADEWALLKIGEERGMSSYQTVYFWAQAILHKCKAAEFIVHEQQMFPILLNKLNNIVESAAQVISAVNSQMPYPYVHLVSFVAHFYLLFCSTWFGCFLHVGFPVSDGLQAEVDESGTLKVTSRSASVSTHPWTSTWCYVLATLATILFQGLLNMHSLLDNPFGSHCAMFPLRQHISEAVNATRTMLMQADELPQAFSEIFRLADSSMDDSDSQHSVTVKAKPKLSRMSARDTFLHPVQRIHRGLSVPDLLQNRSVFGGETSSTDSDGVPAIGDASRPASPKSNAEGQNDHNTSLEKPWAVDMERSTDRNSTM